MFIVEMDGVVDIGCLVDIDYEWNFVLNDRDKCGCVIMV